MKDSERESRQLATKRYHAKTYTQVAVRLPKDLVAAWQEKLTADGIAQAAFIRSAIEAYLGQNKTLS